jgi:CGNR zinc finger protein/putative stress-induced transcription regulator
VPPVTDAELERLVSFLNTIDVVTGSDELADDFACARWLRDQGMPPAGVESVEARQIRDALRSAVEGPPLELPAVPLAVVLEAGTPTLTSSHPLGSLLVTAAQLAIDGRWNRLKLCECHTCRYAFYDNSRNRSGKWCTMRICGNREKTRAFRSRQRDDARRSPVGLAPEPQP